MNGRAITRLALVIASGWLLNLLVVLRFGADHELVPLTAWPMFAESTHEVLKVYRFEVEPAPGAPSRAVPAAEMIARGARVESSVARKLLSDLAASLARAPGRAVPADLVATWFRNAQAHLGLASPPVAITLVRYDYPTGRPRGARLERPLPTTVVRVGLADGERTAE